MDPASSEQSRTRGCSTGVGPGCGCWGAAPAQTGTGTCLHSGECKTEGVGSFLVLNFLSFPFLPPPAPPQSGLGASSVSPDGFAAPRPHNEELLPQLISVHDALVVTEVPALVSDSCLPGISSLPVLPPAFCSCHALLVPGLLPNCFIFVIILRCLGSKRGERRCAQEGLPTDSRAGDTEEQAGKARSAQEPRVMPAQRPAPNGPRQHGLDCSCPKPTVLNRSRENGDSMESYNFVTFGCTAVKPQQWCWQTSRCCSEVTRLKLDW
nr:uncharacterized protein LOC110365612 [Columba livia]